MITYWVNLSLFSDSSLLAKVGRFNGKCQYNSILHSLFSLDRSWLPLSNLYESLLFFDMDVSIYLYIETKQSKLINLNTCNVVDKWICKFNVNTGMQKSSPLVPALQSNWLMMHVSMMLLSYATLIMGLLCILFLVISRYKDVDLKIVDDSSLPLYKLC
jgi:ABC-type transport system involved in cytochrome c biogenesis permease subunit